MPWLTDTFTSAPQVEEELALVRQRKNKVKALMNEATRKHEEEKMKYRDKMIGFNSRWDSLDSDEARLLRLAQGGRPTNGHKANGFRTPDAESDEDDAVFVTPVQRGRSGRYEDSGESDEDSDGDSQERPLPSRPRQDDDYMSEVAVRQQRAAATMAPPPGFGAPAPPGFEQQTPCAPSGAAPPGFDKRSPPGFSRSRPANGTQEDRGAAQLRHNDLRNLLASKRAAAAPPSEGGRHGP
ncbi:hypothetical protein COCSUDRAFT_59794 [Coccomyxa subellipsoidea C-169]|uniref:Uncharacterized protein n=1 Tax=Coccomyxa subellipsoidea (strain C-169) TaxID=574566 RepID=I0YKE8_COCSC|nr:hypothetical protein COCSUDRAFT_59794 [Coccomyxa subellipsoidea C-169]EIE18867.1 hypothetical protein COCSUDRAFT_59794 [Coccomyxa subellipsoidea C-169]|eukprot:XP_005643411.1 hypothetical protein COCSUDRAFT_59794 [Coccomyxa subellipsoidea C-169]